MPGNISDSYRGPTDDKPPVPAFMCDHTVSRGREGQKGSWCVDCGTKILEVHTRPCVECKHYSPDNERVGICRKNLMRVTADMNVTYWLVEGPGRYPLCFEPH